MTDRELREFPPSSQEVLADMIYGCQNWSDATLLTVQLWPHLSRDAAQGARQPCGCGVVCQDLGKEAGCRYMQPSRRDLRKLVDLVYQHAADCVPMTLTADKLIDEVFGPAEAPEHTEGMRAPIAFVPIHPRQGPLWSDTFPAGSEVHRSNSYERMALYADPSQHPSTDQGSAA